MPDFGIFRGFNDKLFGNKLYAGQLPTQLGLIGSLDFGFDDDAEAFFNRVTTAGGTLSSTEKNAINTLVLDLKGYSIWSKMKAIYPMVGASAAACAQNLKSSSFTGSFTSGWTYASTGVTGNGTSAYLNSQLTPIIDLLSTSNHISVYTRTNINGVYYDIGANYPGASADISILSRHNNLFYISNGVQDYKTVSNISSLGFYVNSRTSSSVIKGIKNGSVVINSTASTGLPEVPIYIGALRQFTNTGVQFSPREFAFASIGEGLTDTEASNFYTAVQAFQTTLSRQV